MFYSKIDIGLIICMFCSKICSFWFAHFALCSLHHVRICWCV